MPAVLEKTPDAPLLMSLNIMQHLGTTIDLQQMSISFKHTCRDRVIRVPLFRNASGQLCMSLFGLSKMSTNPERLTVRKVVGDERYLFHTTVMGTDEGNSKVDSHDVTSSNYPENVQNSVAAAIKLSRKSFESSQDISIEPTSNHVRHLRHGGCSYQQERTSRSLVEAEHERTEHHDSSVAASGVSGPFGRSYEEHSVADDDSRNAHPRTDEFLHAEDHQDGNSHRILGGYAAHGRAGSAEVQTTGEDKEKHKQERMERRSRMMGLLSDSTEILENESRASPTKSHGRKIKSAASSYESMGSYTMVESVKNKDKKEKKEKKDKTEQEMDLHRKCLCGLTVTEFVCRKAGPNYMRKFLRCPRERGRQCNFFMTEEGQFEAMNHSHSAKHRKPREIPIPETESSEDSSDVENLPKKNAVQCRQTCKKRGLRIVTNKKTGEKETYFVEINQFVNGSSKK